MVEASRSGLMVADTKDTGKTIRLRVGADLSTPTVTFTKVNGKMIKLKVMVYIHISMDLSMREHGSPINSVVTARSSGLMVHLSKVTTYKARSTAEVDLSGPTVLPMTVNSLTTIFRAVASMSGLTRESTTELG